MTYCISQGGNGSVKSRHFTVMNDGKSCNQRNFLFNVNQVDSGKILSDIITLKVIFFFTHLLFKFLYCNVVLKLSFFFIQ